MKAEVMSYPNHTEKIFVGSEDSFRTFSRINQVLRRWTKQIPLFPQDIEEVLTPIIGQDCLDLRMKVRRPMEIE